MIGCPYCGKEMPPGIPHLAVWECCGEIGHAIDMPYEDAEELSQVARKDSDGPR